jgi:hypothetical protein
MAKKNDSMQKEVEKGEQMDLIDVGPKNSKEIIKHAKLYRSALAKRVDALAEEVAEKHKLLELIDAEHLQRLDDGKIKFKLDGFTITVTPRDELVKIKEDGDEKAA